MYLCVCVGTFVHTINCNAWILALQWCTNLKKRRMIMDSLYLQYMNWPELTWIDLSFPETKPGGHHKLAFWCSYCATSTIHSVQSQLRLPVSAAATWIWGSKWLGFVARQRTGQKTALFEADRHGNGNLGSLGSTPTIICIVYSILWYKVLVTVQPTSPTYQAFDKALLRKTNGS